MGWVINAMIRPLYHGERTGTHFIGGWMGPWAGLDGCEKSRLHRDSIMIRSRYTFIRLSFIEREMIRNASVLTVADAPRLT